MQLQIDPHTISLSFIDKQYSIPELFAQPKLWPLTFMLLNLDRTRYPLDRRFYASLSGCQISVRKRLLYDWDATQLSRLFSNPYISNLLQPVWENDQDTVKYFISSDKIQSIENPLGDPEFKAAHWPLSILRIFFEQAYSNPARFRAVRWNQYAYQFKKEPAYFELCNIFWPAVYEPCYLKFTSLKRLNFWVNAIETRLVKEMVNEVDACMALVSLMSLHVFTKQNEQTLVISTLIIDIFDNPVFKTPLMLPDSNGECTITLSDSIRCFLNRTVSGDKPDINVIVSHLMSLLNFASQSRKKGAAVPAGWFFNIYFLWIRLRGEPPNSFGENELKLIEACAINIFESCPTAENIIHLANIFHSLHYSPFWQLLNLHQQENPALYKVVNKLYLNAASLLTVPVTLCEDEVEIKCDL